MPGRGWVGAGVLGVLVVAGGVGPWVLRDAYAQSLGLALAGPSGAHWLGTDQLGRDLLARLVLGARLSLLIGFGATGFALVVGGVVGAVGGYLGGWVDAVVTRVMDTLISFPGILVALMVIAVAGEGVGNVVLAVGLRGVPVFARLVQASTRAIVVRDYVVAARAIGGGPVRIVVRHVVPGLRNGVVVLGALEVANAILVGATLSFLGVGVSPETPEWGAMLNGGRSYVFQAPGLVVLPGLAIMVAVLGTNLLGDGLRAVLEPRGEGRVSLG